MSFLDTELNKKLLKLTRKILPRKQGRSAFRTCSHSSSLTCSGLITSSMTRLGSWSSNSSNQEIGTNISPQFTKLFSWNKYFYVTWLTSSALEFVNSLSDDFNFEQINDITDSRTLLFCFSGPQSCKKG